jgi:hypothetical protein
VLCQTEVSAFADHGDSGAPVIMLPRGTGLSPPASSALFAGILCCAGPGPGGEVTFLFSPVDAALAELGYVSLTSIYDVASGPGGGTPPSACEKECESSRDQCMKEVATEHHVRPGECVLDLRICERGCGVKVGGPSFPQGENQK